MTDRSTRSFPGSSRKSVFSLPLTIGSASFAGRSIEGSWRELEVPFPVEVQGAGVREVPVRDTAAGVLLPLHGRPRGAHRHGGEDRSIGLLAALPHEAHGSDEGPAA